MQYFTSDLHLFHENIIKLCNRPFSNVSEMHEFFIEKWNDKIKKETDDVYVMGDLFCDIRRNYEEHLKILKFLRGKIFFIFGNHDDPKFYKKYINLKKINILRDIHQFHYRRSDTHKRQLIVLSHYPLFVWNKSFRGSWHLHGHSHKLTEFDNKPGRLAYNVAADLNNFSPLSLNEIEEIMFKKEQG